MHIYLTEILQIILVATAVAIPLFLLGKTTAVINKKCLLSFLAGFCVFLLIVPGIESFFVGIVISVWSHIDPSYVASNFFSAFRILTPSLFEECGRLLMLLIMIRYSKRNLNPIWLGVGYGLSEMLIFFAPLIVSFVQGIVSLTTTSPTETAIIVFERSYTLLAQIGFTLLVYLAIINKKKKIMLFSTAFLFHSLLNSGAVLYDKGILPSIVGAELYGLIISLVVFSLAQHLYHKELRMNAHGRNSNE